MITNELKSQVDKIWETFWTGGISNPLTVVEQFTFLIFIKSLDTAQTKIDKRKKLDSSVKDIFTKENEHLRWQNVSLKTADDMFTTFQTEMYKFIKEIAHEESTFPKYMKDASFLIPTAKNCDPINKDSG